MSPFHSAPALPRDLETSLIDARQRTLDLVHDLDDQELMGPRLAIVNPLLWEIGHVAWFAERWVLREARGLAPLREDGDQLWDSSRVAHDTRWDLPLPSRTETLRYMDAVLERCLAVAGDAGNPDVAYYCRLALFHEDMHDEALTYTRQTLGYPAPRLHLPQMALGADAGSAARDASGIHPPRFVSLPGGEFPLGSTRDEPFVFDNEKWGHPVRVAPFAMAQRAVTYGEMRAFVEDRGYLRRDLWSAEGWDWRQAAGAEHPLYWRRADGRADWELRSFDQWVPLPEERTLIHVNWYEADAYCRWAGARLPTEAEWEFAAAVTPAAKHRFPWGDAAPGPAHANLDGVRLGTTDADAHPAGDSAAGIRQLIGNVWEWTSTPFAPYPAFSVDPYVDYSQPWFDGRHMVLRGGCWATRSRLARAAYRNFYPRDRRDVFGGFRICAR